MTIDYSRQRSSDEPSQIAALQSDGFFLQRQKGSHRHYRHADSRRVTLSFHHASDIFRPGTLRSIIETQARWISEDLERLGLLN